MYVEGGGNDNYTLARCREGFRKFFEKLLAGCRKPKVIACGGRAAAFDRWKTALAQHRDAWCVLLVDSESAIATDVDAWQHVAARIGDNWKKPKGVDGEQLHLMAQCTEAWLVADATALARFYGQGFKAAALPQRKNVEEIPKPDLYAGLKKATRATKTRGPYGKGSHGFELVGLVDPAIVCGVAPRAARLAKALRARLCTEMAATAPAATSTVRPTIRPRRQGD